MSESWSSTYSRSPSRTVPDELATGGPQTAMAFDFPLLSERFRRSPGTHENHDVFRSSVAGKIGP